MKKYILLILLIFFFAPLFTFAETGIGSLIKGASPHVYVIGDDWRLQWIPDETTFNALEYDWSRVIEITDAELSAYTFGGNVPTQEIIENEIVENETAIPTAEEIEEKVSEVFADAPIMISVAKCESGFLQFREDGSLVRSPNGLYIGVFQIDENIHSEYALSLGMDIKTVDGNLAYARHLYDRKGSQPWPACSSKYLPIKRDLEIGDVSRDVRILQELLNKAGFTLARSGPGSPDNETNLFGDLTREAVRKFQCDKDIVCSGDENSTGYGYVGPKTREALANYL